VYPLFKIWTPGQSICFVIRARFMDNNKVELEEEQGPACLLARKFLFYAKVCKVVVVCPYFEGVWVAFQIVTEGLKSTYNGEEFLIVNIVILFCRLERLGVECNRMPAIE